MSFLFLKGTTLEYGDIEIESETGFWRAATEAEQVSGPTLFFSYSDLTSLGN